MLMAFALLFAASQACTDVRQQCRACTVRVGKQICSNIGIACQPLVRVCRPESAAATSNPAALRSQRAGGPQQGQ